VLNVQVTATRGEGHAVKALVTSWKVAESKLDEVDEFLFFIFSIYLILPAALALGVYSASNRMSTTSRKMFLGSKVDRLCGLVVRVPSYRFPGATRISEN
jgi:hypothetical protein